MPIIIQNPSEVLGKSPGWFTRSGSFILFIIILVLVVTSFFIAYPDIIRTKVTITTTNLPTAIIARQSGYLTKIKTKEGAVIHQHDLIGVVQSPIGYASVIRLKEVISLIRNNPKSSVLHELEQIDSLGTLSISYNTLINTLNGFYQHINDPLFEIQNRKLEIDISNNKLTIKKLKRQLNTTAKSLQINDIQFNRDSLLLVEGVIAKQQFEESQKNYITQNQQADDLRSEIEAQLKLIESLLLQKEELNKSRDETTKKLQQEVNQAIKTLENELYLWDQNYVLHAPITGQVSYFKLLDKNQYVQAGDELMFILPEVKGIFGYCEVPSLGVGKVQPDQRVQIRLDNYPYQEFGTIEGTVRSISEVSVDNAYLIKLNIPQQLVTNYGRTLNFKQEMSGEALIITKDLRLIDRIFSQLNSFTSR